MVNVQGTVPGSNLRQSIISDSTSTEVVLTISGTGAMPDYTTWKNSNNATTAMIGSFGIRPKTQGSYANTTPWVNYIKDTAGYAPITKIVVENGVTSIGGCAFWGGDSLKYVQLANTVTTIGQGAFAYCGELLECNHPEVTLEKYAFQECAKYASGLTANNLETIGDAVFADCNLEFGEVILPKIKTIGGAFSGGYSANSLMNISKLQLGDTLTEIKVTAFYQVSINCDLTIMHGKVDQQAFQHSVITGRLRIGPDVTLDKGAFQDTTVRGGVVFDEGRGTIPESCFNGSIVSGTVVIPSSVTSIGAYAFYTLTSASMNLYLYADPYKLPTTLPDMIFDTPNLQYSVNVPTGNYAGFVARYGNKYRWTELTNMPLKVYYKDSDGKWKQGIMQYKNSAGWQKGTKVYIKRNKESSTTGETIWVGKTS